MKKLFNLSTFLAGSALALIIGQESIKFYGPHSVHANQKIQEKTQRPSIINLELALKHQEGPFIEKPRLKTLQIPQEYFGNYPDFKYPENSKKFDKDPDVLLLARAFFGEARREINTNPEYVYMVAESIQSRMKDGKTLKEVLLEQTLNPAKNTIVYHYSCFAPNNPMFSKIRDPKEIQTFEKCYTLARFFLSKDYKNPYPELKGITNYFVSTGNPKKNRTKKEADLHTIPSWAYQKDTGGKFQLNGGERIPIEPLAIVKLENNKNAYGYKLGL